MKSQQSKTPAVLKLCAAAILGLGAMTAGAGESVAPVAQAPASDQTDRLIVKYKDEAAPMSIKTAPGMMTAQAAAPALSNARVSLLNTTGRKFGTAMNVLHTIATGARVVKLDRKMSLDDVRKVAADLVASDPSVEYAEPDRMMHKLMTPNDTNYSQQWDLFDATAGINMPAAWDKSTGSGIKVAVIDTGYRPHADLSGQILQGYDFISDTAVSNDGNGRDTDASDPGDWVAAGECGSGQPAENSSWHGTHVAGTIAALTNNGAGVAGVAYGAKIVPARVLGKCGGYTSDIADAIVWASGGTVSGVPANANKAQVISMSLGGSGACDTTTQSAINGARSRGTVVVVAAGNEAQNASNSSPANCSGTIVVAATGKTGGRASYSNYGTIVTLAAPGGDGSYGILSTLNAGTKTPGADSYAAYQGTSMATPHVSAVVALMLAKNPSLTPDDVAARLKSSARAFPASCSGCGAGLLNASAAIDAATGSGTTTGPTISETESNNTITTANSVTTTGTTVNGTMSSSSDTDYFVVQLPAGKTLSATLTPNSSSDYDLYIYNSSGTQLASSTNGSGSIDSASSANTGSSTSARYVRVVYYSGGTGSTSGKYTLKLSW